MGERYDEVAEEVKRVPYEVAKADNGTVRVLVDGREYTPQEISAMILQKMKKTAGGLPGPDCRRGRNHRARLLQRFTASGYQGSR